MAPPPARDQVAHCAPSPPAGLLPTLKADAVFLSPPWGGLDYDEKAEGEFDLTADMQPCCGFDLFDAACMAACSTRRLGGATACHPSLERTLEGLGCSTHSRPSDRTHRPVPRSLVLRMVTSSGHIQAPPHPP